MKGPMCSRSIHRGSRPQAARAPLRRLIRRAQTGGCVELGRSTRRFHSRRSRGSIECVGQKGTRRARSRNRGRLDRSDSVARSYRPLAAGRSPAAEPGQFDWAVPPEALIESSRRDKLAAGSCARGPRRPSSTRPTPRAWPGRLWV